MNKIDHLHIQIKLKRWTKTCFWTYNYSISFKYSLYCLELAYFMFFGSIYSFTIISSIL